MNRKGQGEMAVAFVVIVVVIGIISFFYFTMTHDMVDANHIGVMNKFGDVQGTIGEGLHNTGFFMEVIQYDKRLRKLEIAMLPPSEGGTSAQSSVDKDGQAVYARIVVNYKLNPDAAERVYRELGRDDVLVESLALPDLIREGFKSVTSKYSSKQIFQKRDEVKQEAIDRITSVFPHDYFQLVSVYIPDLDFNREFLDAIEKTKVNEQLQLAKEAEEKIADSEARIQVTRAGAQAKSDQLLAEAQYRADALKLQLQREELSPQLIQKLWIDQWSGNFPANMVVTPEQGAMILNLGAIPQTGVAVNGNVK